MRSARPCMAVLLLAGAAVAHGVHDLRGEIRLEEQRLRIDIEQRDSHSGDRRCLRLLGELRILDDEGRRLVGTKDEDENRCRLEYAVAPGATELTLQVHPSRRGPQRHERLILQQWREGSVYRGAIVLTRWGNIETLALPAP